MFPLLAVAAVLVAPTQLLAQESNTRPANVNRSAHLKSAIVRGSGNVILRGSRASFIGAGQRNQIGFGITNGVIGGGFGNRIGGQFAAIVGGWRNTNTGSAGFIGGGSGNTILPPSLSLGPPDSAFIGGGRGNTNSGICTTIGGGLLNSVSGLASTVMGGWSNTAGGTASTVACGFMNTASSAFSLAAGVRAKAIHDGCFVWADITDADFSSTGSNQFLVRAEYAGVNAANRITPDTVFGVRSTNTSSWGGMYIQTSGAAAKPFYGYSVNGGSDAWTEVDGSDAKKWKLWVSGGTLAMTVTAGGNVGIGNNSPTTLLQVGGATCDGTSWNVASDRNLKKEFKDIDGGEILRKVSALPIQEWAYKTSTNGSRHIGPTAQDFRAAFGLGDNDKTISTIDPSGVALAAIQGLVAELKERDKAMVERDEKIDKLETELKAVRMMLSNLPPR